MDGEVQVRAPARAGPSKRKVGFGYGLMTAAAAALFLLINHHGQTLTAPAGGPPVVPGRAGSDADTLLHVLLALAAVVVAGQALAWVFAHVSQPPVIVP